jgi:deazaflavin-dependent oxidoreductase (nitroreductase family)
LSGDTQYLYLTTTGWKSGRPHEIEIWYVVYDGGYYLCAEHRQNAHWVRNILHTPDVTYRLGDHSGQATASVLNDHASQTAPVRALFEEKYHWSDGLLVAIVPNPHPE